MSHEDHPAPDRPFYFVVVLWGERFRNYFLEYCLPSLLAPGNIPALGPGAHKFLIATRPDDWAAMAETPIFKRLGHYVLPAFCEIPPCPPDKSGAEHMGQGHKLCCDLAFHDRAYGMVLTPDSMLSDGTIARLQELARSGTKLVLAAALRFGEEPFLAKLSEIGAVPAASRRDNGAPLSISGRQMVRAAVNGFHSETQRYEWDAPSFPPFFPGVPAAAWWRVPGEDGIVLHSLSWAPLLIDYAAVGKHDSSDLDNWTLDGDYIFANLGQTDASHVVTDSDEMFIASWGPLAERPLSLDERAFFGRVGRGAMFRFAFYGPVFNPLKRRIFLNTVRWHANVLNDRWTGVEARSMRAVDAYADPPSTIGHAPMRTLWHGVLYIVALMEWMRRLPRAIALWHSLHRERIALALRGDVAALRWVWWTARRLLASLRGRRFEERRPDAPAI